MPTTSQRAVALESSLFAGLGEAASSCLLALARSRAFAAGSHVFRQGDVPTRLCMVVEGMVKVWKLAPGGAPVTVHMMGPGQLVGCVAACCGIAFPANATAVEASRLLVWPADDMNRLLQEYPALAANALRIVGGRRALFLERIQDLSTENAETRIARALLRLAVGAEGGAVRVSRQELADLTATTLHTVSRAVSQWQRQGLVESGRRRIAVIDAAAMNARFG